MKYSLPKDADINTSDPLLGPIEASFKAGIVSPKNESEEVALERLVEGGFAERATEAKNKKAAVAEEED